MEGRWESLPQNNYNSDVENLLERPEGKFLL